MNNTQYIFLDDIRVPERTKHVQLPQVPWTIVRNYNQFVQTIKEIHHELGQAPLFIAFDHDLAHEHYRESMYNPDRHYSEYYTDGTFKEKTGYCCAKWLVEYCLKYDLTIPNWICHSMNPIGRENINAIMNTGAHAQSVARTTKN